MLCFFSRFANTSFESFGPRPGPDQGHISTQILQHLHENEASFYLNSAICKFSENAAFRITVRRQPTWDQWALFLRDTFLPVASPV